MYPFNHKMGQKIQTDVNGVSVDHAFLAHMQISAVSAVATNNAGVHAAMTGVAQSAIKTGITSPVYPRNITATAGGTATDIKAIQVVITGTNYNDEAITETLPVFTVDTAGTVVGAKAFKTVTQIDVPAHDGSGATTTIGWGDKLGLPYKLTHNTVLAACLNNVKESTAPTITFSAAAIESNTIDLNSALDGHVVDVYLIV